MNETERTRRAALMLNRTEFDRLDNALVGVIGQAFGASGRIYSHADRVNVWRAIERYQTERQKRQEAK